MKARFNPEAFYRVCEDGRRRFERHKSNLGNIRQAQIDFLKKLLDDNKDTEYGKRYDFANIRSYEDYQKNVPLTEYDDYASDIELMTEKGETGHITEYPVVHYAATSGSTGKPKKIPVSDEGRRLFSDFGGTVILYQLSEQIKKQNHQPGPICFMADFHWDMLPIGKTYGSISAQMSYNFRHELDSISTSPSALQFLSEPAADAPYLKALFALMHRDTSCLFATFSPAVFEMMHLIEVRWKELVNDIRTGTLNADLVISEELRKSMEDELSPDSDRANELETEFLKGFDSPIIPRIWPNMSMICCIGGSFFSEYTIKVRSRYSGDIPIHMAVYGASESMLAVPLVCDDTEYSLLNDEVFFEFRPVTDGAPEEDSFYLLDELEAGRDYEIIVTNISGFYRYRMMDVIHIEENGKEGPKGHITYRLNQVVNMVGEHATTEQLDDVIRSLSEHIGVNISNYALYPDHSTSPGRYILVVEPDEYRGKGDQPELGPVVDKLLCEANRSFNKYREISTMGEPLVTFIEPDSFQLYRELQIASGVSPNQVKPVKIIDNEAKTRFFFGLSEGVYKATRRLLYDAEQKLERMKLLEEENARLKKELAALRSER